MAENDVRVKSHDPMMSLLISEAFDLRKIELLFTISKSEPFQMSEK